MKENPGEENQTFFDRQKLLQKILLTLTNIFGAYVAIQVIRTYPLPEWFSYTIVPMSGFAIQPILRLIDDNV